MGRAVNYAPSTLSDAVQGKRLPTRAVTEAFVRACGGDPAVWGERWEQTVREISGLTAAVDEVSPRRRGTGLLREAALVLITAVVTATATWLVLADRGAPAAPIPSASPSAFTLPADGTDPATAGCGFGDTVLGEVQIKLGGSGSGMLELKYSARCQGGWARFYLNPNSTPVPVEVRVQASDGRASAFAYLAEGNTPVYTDLLHASGGGCLTASVVIRAANTAPLTGRTTCLAG